MFPNFNPVPTFAIQLSANVIDTQLEVLWQCCKAECGSYYIFSSPFPFTSTWDSSLQSQRLENTSMGQSKFHGCTRVSGQYLHFILGNC